MLKQKMKEVKDELAIGLGSADMADKVMSLIEMASQLGPNSPESKKEETSVDLGPILERLEALEKRVEEKELTFSKSSIDESLKALEGEIREQLKEEVQKLTPAEPVNLGPINMEISGLKKSIEELAKKVEEKPVAETTAKTTKKTTAKK